ncbi:hypothetical protein [uncultured Campylobacter sp.]|uniref:hypothetical protein n=1 Tax=uncultured Campylobacter sp. TaxID=218934 RepID=UPI002636BFFA|nr:hypothetical protein [uncultured Campylobacter sp.]
MRKISLLILGLCAFLNAENLNGANSNATKPSIAAAKEQNSINLAIKEPKTGAQSPNAKKQAVMKPETSKSPTVAMQKSAAEANSSVKTSAAKKAVSAQLSQTEKKAPALKAGIGAPSQAIKTERNSSAQPSVTMLPPPDELPILPEVSEPNSTIVQNFKAAQNSTAQNSTVQDSTMQQNAQFAPQNSNPAQSSVATSQNAPAPKNFTQQTFALPSDALTIESLIVRYRDDDGVLHEKIVDVNRSIDWHDDFVLSASAKPALHRALDVSVTSTDPNLQKQASQSGITPSFAPRLELPLETLKFDDGLKFVIRKDSVQLITADDFKSSDANASGTLEAEFWRQEIPLSGASFAVNIGGFSDINVTKEDGYYRIGVRSHEGNLSIRRKDGGYLIYKNSN